MELELVPRSLELSHSHVGRPQQAGPLVMVSLHGAQASGDAEQRFTAPLTGLKLAGVRGYGNVELKNHGRAGVAIVPLHMGYIQDQAQNHALCGAALLGAGQKRLLEDACCVQQGQGGYLESKEQWFFILPLALREEALQLIGQKSYSKLWTAIACFNDQFGLQHRGHLEQVICRQRSHLTQYQSRLELMPNQTGALFFLGGQLVGVEMAPSAAYFREVWMPLVCFCYGTAAMEAERRNTVSAKVPVALPYRVNNLSDLRNQLLEQRQQRARRVQEWLERTPTQSFVVEEQERYLDLRLHTVNSDRFTGQYVSEKDRVVYVSLTIRANLLREAMDNPVNWN